LVSLQEMAVRRWSATLDGYNINTIYANTKLIMVDGVSIVCNQTPAGASER
tara:strand:- start:448 stop:600 length:153 start_codon:yes stop_codon:yes gene_type:complete